MVDEPVFTLTHTFTYKGNEDVYTISFYKTKLIVESEALSDEICYKSIAKAKYSSRYFKLELKNKDKIKIPTTIKEMNKLSEMFSTKEIEKVSEECLGVALVEFGKEYFYVKIPSYSIGEFKTKLIQRISSHFHPAISHTEPDTNHFQKFAIYAINNGKTSCLTNEDDLYACCKYNDGKIYITIKLIE